MYLSEKEILISFFFLLWYSYSGENMLKEVFKLLLVILWMGLIFSLSQENDVQSSRRSDHMIIRVGQFIVGHSFTDEERELFLEQYVFIVRKSAHIIIYFVLGVLVFSFLQEFSFSMQKLFLFAFLWIFLYSCTDEIHQMFIAGRSGEFRDIFIDSFGGLCGISFLFFKRLRRFYHEQKEATR